MSDSFVSCTVASAEPASTFGWDTVYALPFSVLNAAIAAQETWPKTFNQSTSGSGLNATLSGTFGPWSLVSGGNGLNVRLSTPVARGAVELSGASTETLDLNTVSVTIQCTLRFSPAAAGSASQELRIVTQPGAVTVLPLGGFSGSPVVGALLQSALSEWFTANLSALSAVFASVNLKPSALTGGLSWLAPTSLGYAVADPPAGSQGESVFAVLAMLDGAPPPGDFQVSPFVLPAAPARAALLVSYKRVTRYLVAPYLATLFPNMPQSAYNISPDGTTISNGAAANFTLSDASGHSYPAQLPAGGFQLSFAATSLSLQFANVSYPYSSEVNVSVTYNGTAALGLDGNGHLAFRMVGTPTCNVSTSVNKAYIAEVVAAGTFVAIAGLALGGLLDGLDGAAVDGAIASADEAASAAYGEAEAAAAPEAAAPLEGIDPALASNSEAAQASDAEAASSELANPGATQPLAGWYRRNLMKIWCGVVSGLAGGAITQMPTILSNMAERDAQNIPTIDGFVSAMFASVSWPGTLGTRPVCAGLNGGLLLGLSVNAGPT